MLTALRLRVPRFSARGLLTLLMAAAIGLMPFGGKNAVPTVVAHECNALLPAFVDCCVILDIDVPPSG